MNVGTAAGVLGAASMVGESLIPLLINEGRHVFAFSRKAPVAKAEAGVSWMRLSAPGHDSSEVPIVEEWLCLAPIQV
ncbi:MAG: hypothetical protein ABR512_13565, partial [Desulfopila sp.]